MAADQNTTVALKPLKISCTSSDCENGLHCFLQTQKMAAEGLQRRCRSCGAELVDWRRVHSRDIVDVGYTFSTLKYELIRHHFWHIEIDQRAVNHARRKGEEGMRVASEKRLRKYVGPSEPAYDGRQTPTSGNAIYYAQHATAACCRKCIEEWHGIPQGQELTDQEITYLTDLTMLYINERLPFLTERGEKVPPLRRQR